MNYTEYKNLFDEILNSSAPPAPYNDEAYLSYTKLNRSRMNRWDKQMQLDDGLVSAIRNEKAIRKWIIITEPWCGDAAHIVPFLVKLAEQGENISYEILLRDKEPFLIENYLTNGTRSIPKLIVRDENGKDIFTWGPRPAGAQKLVEELKATGADFEATKIALQNWYNEDKGSSVFSELKQLLKNEEV